MKVFSQCLVYSRHIKMVFGSRLSFLSKKIMLDKWQRKESEPFPLPPRN